ncbi:ATP-binding protein [Actinomadura harenae]|uniref:ATP-binding protein n=2 Tax=Actinomadura harenae TaxID=2483351 RepID=A0A3M2M5L2_9ACTN|nr:ATP-binding protein [Actinomadura harenae]
MAEVGFDASLVEDGVLAVSELATNAYRHAGGSIELWVWARSRPRSELVVSVFDGNRAALPAVHGGELLDESGKGLGIVAAVASGWGCHLSRSRLSHAPVVGKAAWFTLPLPERWPRPPWRVAPRIAARRLVDALAARGLRAEWSSDGAVSIVSVGGLNVWVCPLTFSWRGPQGVYVRHPLIDLQEAAERVVQAVEAGVCPTGKCGGGCDVSGVGGAVES